MARREIWWRRKTKRKRKAHINEDNHRQEMPTDRYDVRSRDCHVIRPTCITILYSNSFLFIDIFHDMMLFLCCFGLFYTVYNFPVQKKQTQDSAVKSGR